MSELSIYQGGAITAQELSDELFRRFIAYTDREPTTVKGYITCLRQFLKWLHENGITHPQRDDILAYKEYLNGETFGRSGQEPLRTGTKQQYLRAVKHFFRWTASEGLYPNISDNIHTAKVQSGGPHKKDALGREDVAIVAQHIDRSTEQGRRLYAMYLLCISCAMRTIEVSRANVEDIKTLGGRTYLYLQGKGHQEHDQPVLLIDEVKDALKEYLESRSDRYTAKSPLFVSTSNRSKGRRIAPTTISSMLKEALVEAGYDSDRLTAHSLRHTSNTGAYRATHSLLLAQKHARHVDPATTEIYVHAEEREERNTEQQVYNYFFKAGEGTDILQDTISLVGSLDAAKLQAVHDFILAIR